MIDEPNNNTASIGQSGIDIDPPSIVSKPLIALLGLALISFFSANTYFNAPDQSNDYGKTLAGRPYWTYDAAPRSIPNLALTDGSGATFHLSDFKGHYVLVNIWETNCYASHYILPGLNNLSTHFSDNQLKIVNLAEDHGGINTVKSYYKENGYTNLAPYSDPTGNARYELGLRGIPSFLLLNPDGKEIVRLEGTMDFNLPENLQWLRSVIKQ